MDYIYLSDIHGNIEALKQIENLEEFHDKNTQFRFGGDYIDGFNLKPNATKDTLNYIKNLCDTGRAKAILGNHDDFLYKEVYRPYDSNYWSLNGRENTLENLGISNYDVREQMLFNYYEIMEWIKELPLYLEDGNNILVHAGVLLDKPLSQQRRDDLLWAREYYYNYPHPFLVHKSYKYKTIVSGHTPTFAICGDPECPIVEKNISLVKRYFIDGGSKGSPTHKGRINLLKLSHKGNVIWSKYITEEGIFNY